MVRTLSKISVFLIPLSFLLLLTGCERRKNDVIPDVYVSFTIDLYDFPNLSYDAGSDTVDALDLRIDRGRQYAGGYNLNGIIIYRDSYGFYAYDRTCPHDYVNNNKSIKVLLDGIYAVCPECGTTYALPVNGTPSSGPGKYYLKNYKTSFDGRFLSVWNY